MSESQKKSILPWILIWIVSILAFGGVMFLVFNSPLAFIAEIPIIKNVAGVGIFTIIFVIVTLFVGWLFSTGDDI